MDSFLILHSSNLSSIVALVSNLQTLARNSLGGGLPNIFYFVRMKERSPTLCRGSGRPPPRLDFQRARLYRLLLVLTLMASAPRLTGATTAYDCESQAAKLATISLDSVGDCQPLNETYHPETPVSVQVLQRSSKASIEAYACQLRISRGEQWISNQKRFQHDTVLGVSAAFAFSVSVCTPDIVYTEALAVACGSLLSAKWQCDGGSLHTQG